MISISQFISGFTIDMEMVHGDMRPLLGLLGDYRNLNLNVIQRLTSLTQLFPHTFKEKLLEQLLVSFVSPAFLIILMSKKIPRRLKNFAIF